MITNTDGSSEGQTMIEHSSSLDATVVDGLSLFGATEALAERIGANRVTIDYRRLRSVVESLRKDAGWRDATLNTILLAVDPESEGQHRFKTMISHAGFLPDIVHYRNSYLSVRAGSSLRDREAKQFASLSSRISYIIGLIARYRDPHFVVVSHAFELHGPLADLANRVKSNGGRVGLAYFSSLLDERWYSAGMRDQNQPITFFDLDPYSKEILGVNLENTVPARVVKDESALSQF
jgi:hypothetical protein